MSIFLNFEATHEDFKARDDIVRDSVEICRTNGGDPRIVVREMIKTNKYTRSLTPSDGAVAVMVQRVRQGLARANEYRY